VIDLRPLLATLWLLWPGSAALAGTVEQVRADYEDGVYTVDLAMVLNATVAKVQDIVTDYDGLNRLSSSIKESRRLPPSDADSERRRVVYRACFLIYCFTAAMVESVHFPAPGRMLSIVEPEGSDFVTGYSEWDFSAVGETQTRIQFHSQLQPRFWVPPVVGPWIIKRKMMIAAKETGIRIEKLAR
jgi:hypothetical protein